MIQSRARVRHCTRLQPRPRAIMTDSRPFNALVLTASRIKAAALIWHLMRRALPSTGGLMKPRYTFYSASGNYFSHAARISLALHCCTAYYACATRSRNLDAFMSVFLRDDTKLRLSRRLTIRLTARPRATRMKSCEIESNCAAE